MKTTALALAALMATGIAVYASEGPDAATIEKINALLASMTCEVDEDNIEIEDDGFELDDVICADGQYDVMLDKDLNVTGKRKE